MKFLIIIIILLVPSIVSAATTGLSASNFSVAQEPGQITTRELWVTNTDTIAQKYELELDNKSLQANISFSPNEFYLDPEKSQNVIIRFRQPKDSLKTYLSLLALDSSQSSNFKVGNGIKIPVQFRTAQVAGARTVNIIQDVDNFSLNMSLFHIVIYIIDGILLGLVAFYLSRRRLKYNNSRNYKINFL